MPFPANLDLSSLNGANGFTISGVAADDHSGISVASAGDVNGDGFADVIVGAWGTDLNGDDSGASYVVFGRASGFGANLDLSTLDGANGFKLSGVAAGDGSGGTVASAGDVNGDGFADLIISASLADPHGDNSGASYVVFGKASGFAANFDLSTLDGANGFKLSGVAAGDLSGGSVASAGDVNGDGFADLIIGADLADPHGDSSGASYVVFGKASGFAANFDLSTLDGANGFKLSGVTANDYSGGEVASAGDVNGDGFADLIVSAYVADPHGDASGESYVVFGKASGFSANLDLSTLNGTNGFKLSGVSEDDWTGGSVASAGDVNGDGFADLIVGAAQADPHGDVSGASYVVFGKASGFGANLDLSALNGANGFKLSGVAEDDHSGFSVASAGDVNGDGFADLIVGAYAADPHGSSSGESYVVFGKASGFAANLDLSTLNGANGFKLSGVAAGDHSGISVASAGDVNGDGFADLIVDTMRGGLGDDTYVVDDGSDQVIEGAGQGTDSVFASVSLTLAANVENLTLTSGAAINGTGNDLANIITGNDAANVLAGGLGNDSLTGGAGADSFVFNSALDKKTNVDTLLDFSHADDTILLDSAIFKKLKEGELKNKYFEVGKKADDGNDYIVYNKRTGDLFYDKNGDKKGGAILFAHLDDHLKLKADDFLVV